VLAIWKKVVCSSKFLRNPHNGASRTGIDGEFGLRGFNGSAYRLEQWLVIRMLRYVSTDLSWSYGFSYRPLDQAVLEGMKTDNYQPSSRAQQVDRFFQPSGQLSQFIIYKYPDCLKASCRWMLILFPATYRILDQSRQLTGRFKPLLLPGQYDAPGNPARVALLSELP
jgi:hypothetical protein